jgi:Uma2 family endonuclease
MSSAQKIIPHYTYDDYIHWEGKWELIEGHPIAMSPSPVPKHQWVANMLQVEFTLALRSACKSCKVYPSLDFKIAEDTVVQPDILIVCTEISKNYLDFSPVLVVEILSPSTALRDRNTKFDIYELQGIKYYLIVDIEKEHFELYELMDGKYVIAEHDFDHPFLFSFDQEGCSSVSLTLNNVW